jgi:O-succinylbenzoate synthase
VTIWVHRYELVPRARLNARAGTGPRRGALLRVGHSRDTGLDTGFADVHPWPELGDAPLDEQLALLARGGTTPLTVQSLHFASLDAAARREGRSLFDGLTIPESHWPAAAGEAPSAFDTVKVKMPGGELPPRGRLRLDFNATLDAPAFLRIAATLPRERIDFVEDPCPYDAVIWRELHAQTGLRLALDREVATEGVDVLVVKPALQRVPGEQALGERVAADGARVAGERAAGGERGGDPDVGAVSIVVTSYMDHPVGQLHAAAIAARCATDSRCGLMTHVLFEPNKFSERLGLDGARLVPPGGAGIGFEYLLEELEWTRLA